MMSMWEYDMAQQTVKRTTVSEFDLRRLRAFREEYQRLAAQPDFYAHTNRTAMDKNALLAQLIGYVGALEDELSE